MRLRRSVQHASGVVVQQEGEQKDAHGDGGSAVEKTGT